MSITDHRPWRGIAAVVHHKRHGEHEVTVEVRDVAPVADVSIREWLDMPRVPSAAEQAPTQPLPMVRPNTGPDDVQGVSRMPFTVHRELDDDEALAERLLRMEREEHALADQLAGENDTRMTLLLARSRALGVRWEQSKTKATFARRREQIRALVPALGHLLAAGDVDQATAARIVSMRSRYLSSPEDSGLAAKMTPELLAAMDAERGAA